MSGICQETQWECNMPIPGITDSKLSNQVVETCIIVDDQGNILSDDARALISYDEIPNIARVNETTYQRLLTESKLSSHTVSVPAGTLDGHTTIYCIFIQGFGAAEINDPPGLTLLKHRVNDGSGTSYSWYARTASSEPSSYSFTTTITTHATIFATTYSGVTGVTAGDLNFTEEVGGEFKAPSMATAPGTLLCYYGKNGSGSPDTAETEPDGMTQVSFTGAAETMLALYEEVEIGSSPTDDKFFDFSAGLKPVGLQIMLT